MDTQQYTEVLSYLLHDAFLLILFASSLIALFTGLLFLFAPNKALKINDFLSQWVSLRQSTRHLETPYSIDKALYRQHRKLGLVIILGSTYVLYQFAFNYQHGTAVTIFGHSELNQEVTDWLLSAILYFTIPLTLFTLLFGTALTIRPSLLKTIEKRSNHWVSTRKSLQPLEAPNLSLDRWVSAHPHLFGAITTLISAYLSGVFLILLIQ